ncbi:hypothetical protein WOLCODRAFT_138070 [Wolfiporia cocos MD-104 SS10]|uniref:YMC020W-like alpha/beta hydrolase domain-containing protein n=1 Tax=Wolfiporia cocos (strain MD-104) TaxID=742152 RepID=A0A2H3JKT1_WOLCO|nr:hypothetical protein WOLCODRAFT_138070 [Wolfiporia cocos MD-104 SS10]
MSSSKPTPRRRSTHTPAPAWQRTLSIPKSQQSASVSLVFAQPEQGAKLQSAADHLPAVAPTITIPEDGSSASSIASRKREGRSPITDGFGGVAHDPKRTRTLSVTSPPAEIMVTSPSDETLQGEGDDNKRVLSESPESMHEELPPVEVIPQPVPIPIAEPPPKAASPMRSPLSRSSWFGSISRSLTREPTLKQDGFSQEPPAAAQDPPPEASPTATAPTATETATQTPSAAVSGTNSPSTQSVPFPTRRTSRASPPARSPRAREVSAAASSARLIDSPSALSIDEEVPRPRVSSQGSPPSEPAQAILHSQSEEALRMGRKPSVTSLNPSTSRFALRLPLLGRPKVPLQQLAGDEPDRKNGESENLASNGDTVRAGEAEIHTPAHDDSAMLPHSINDGTEVSGLAPPPTTSPGLSLNTLSESPVHMTASQAASFIEDDKTPMPKTHAAATTSWWDYVGWSHSMQQDTTLANATDGETPKAEVAQVPEASESTADAEPTLPALAPEENATTVTPTSTTTAPQAAPLPAPQPSVPSPSVPASDSATQAPVSVVIPESTSASEQKPPSITSAKSHGTMWYSPWAWYSMSPTASGTTSPQVAQRPDDAKGSADPPPPSEPPKTESEMVKERALAREDLPPADVPSSAASAPEPPASPPQAVPKPARRASVLSVESQNPIGSSITQSRSGWANFFMSRALLTKSVSSEEERDNGEGGMEVMEVDEEDGGQMYMHAQTSAQPADAETQPVAIPPEKQVASGQPSSIPSVSVSPAPKSPLEVTKREHRKSVVSLAGDARRRGSIKRAGTRTPSPAPSNASRTSAGRPSSRNLVLPGWEDTFLLPPRSNVPPKPQQQGAKSKLSKTISLVSGVLFNKDEPEGKGKEKERERERQAQFIHFGKELPKAFGVLEQELDAYMLNGGCRVVVVGVAGWSPGPVTRTLAGGLPSSSTKFVDMTCQALAQFEEEHGFRFKKITRIPLEGDGPIEMKISKLHEHLLGDEDWMEDLHAADVIFVAAHSQGCIVATHLIDRLIRDGHILTSRNVDMVAQTAAAIAPGSAAIPSTQAQRICFLALCGIHLGPLRYLGASSLLQPYIQYFENAAARELFEFQNTESRLSKNYVKALQNVMDHGTKTVYIASLNDQVVPIYSGLFTAASHPRILRALYIDGDAYHSSDFLSNLLVLLIRIMNAGLSDGGLLTHLSEATAGTLSGVGHSSVYEELATFSLAVKYFFLANDGEDDAKKLVIEPFNAINEQNDYEIPWSLRDMIADERVAHFFAREFAHLRDAFDDWQPKTTILRDVKRKLQPIQRLTSFTPSVSKL